MTQVRLRLEPAQAGWAVVQLVGTGGKPSGGLDVPGKGVVLDLVVPAKALAADGTVVVELLPTCRSGAAGEEVQSSPGVWVPAGVTPRVTPPGLVYRADLAAGGRQERLLFGVPSVTAGTIVDAVAYIVEVPGALPQAALAEEVARAQAAETANATAIAGKQAADADLTTIAALDATIAGALATDGAGWVRKSYAQLKTALGLVKADVGLGSVDNTADTAKPVSLAQQAALDAKVPLTVVDAKGDLLVGTADNTVGRLAATANGFVLTLDSAEATGMKWAAAAAGGGGGASLTADQTFTGLNTFSGTSLKVTAGFIQVGSGGTATGDDAILVSRATGGSGGPHAFRDQSTYDGTFATASYDTALQVNGGAAYNHMHGYQTRQIWNGTGSMGGMRGFHSAPVVNGTGVVQQINHFEVADAVGSGAIPTQQIGFYIGSLTKATTNYAIYSAAAAASSYFAAKMMIGKNSNDSGGTAEGHLQLRASDIGGGYGAGMLAAGYATTSKFGWVQASHFNLGIYAPLALNPNGGNIGLFTATAFGGGAKVVGIANCTTVPTSNPAGGVVVYAEGGALKCRGSNGTVTTLGVA